MPPLYIVNMVLYTFLTAFILYIIISNMFTAKTIWEQILAVFVIVPFAMRLFFIK